MRFCESAVHTDRRPRQATHYLPPDIRGNGIYLCAGCSRGEPSRLTLAQACAHAYELHATARWTGTPQGQDLKHLALHVAKTAGKICALVEKLDHGPVDQRLFLDLVGKDVPDLVILAAMFMDAVEPHWHRFDLNDVVDHRGREISRRAP